MGPEEIYRIVNGYKSARVLLTAVELRIFDAIDEAGSGSDVVAARTRSDVRATDRLLNVLVSAGLLEKHDECFIHTEGSRRYLTSASPDYLANLTHSVHLWDSWSTLTEAVQRGGPTEARFKAREKPERTESFIAAMHHFGLSRAQETVDAFDLSGVSSVLDIGGGSGAYSIAFVQAIGEHGRATVFDLPGVLPLTARYIAEAGLSERISTCEGDYLSDSLPMGFDLAFLSAIVHIQSDEENSALIGRVAAALNPGGQLAVRDFFVDEDRSGPAHATMFALNMLVNTDSGDTFTESEMRAWFTNAGLTNIRRVVHGPGLGMLIGTRARS